MEIERKGWPEVQEVDIGHLASHESPAVGEQEAWVIGHVRVKTEGKKECHGEPKGGEYEVYGSKLPHSRNL